MDSNSGSKMPEINYDNAAKHYLVSELLKSINDELSIIEVDSRIAVKINPSAIVLFVVSAYVLVKLFS